MIHKIWKKRIVLILLILAWMGLIFYFSAQNADVSSAQGGNITEIVEKVFFPDWEETLPEDEYLIWQGHLSFLVRKVAHFTEFAVFGILLALLAATFPLSWWLQWLLVIGIGALYAFSDELHQSIVDGRDCTVFDMVVDTTGVIVGSISTLGIKALSALTKQNKSV